MAKLQKGLQDYFRIPVLLKPLAETPQSSIKNIHTLLSSYPQAFSMNQNYPVPQTAHSRILKQRSNTAQQTITFMMNDFINQWVQFQIIYRCRFAIGVFESNGKIVNLQQQWNKASKICQDENRKLIGLLILDLGECSLEGIEFSKTVIPPAIKLSNNAEEISACIQPWLYYEILPIMQDYICFLISQIQKQDNGFIVFNKNEEKPEPRTLKKKKKGRCLKICGDFCLVLRLIQKAHNYFREAEEILKKVDDYLWALGCGQGKLACYMNDQGELSGINKQEMLQQTRQDCFNLGKKIKDRQLETQNYFKILKIYVNISESFDNMAKDFLNYILANFSSSEKFSVLTQLSMLYKQAGMPRKHNHILYLASRIAMQLNPSLVNILLTETLKSGHLKKWPLINANIIKLIIDNGTDSKQGLLHLDLLENCCPVLTKRDIQVTIEALQHRNFENLNLQKSAIFQLVSVSCLESEIKPKLNRIGDESPQKPQTGFFMNWKKKEVIYLFQQQETINFEIKIRNNALFPLRCSLRLIFQKPLKTTFHSFFLQPKMNKVTLTQKFSEIRNLVVLQAVELKFFNFSYLESANKFTPLKLQIYEQYPNFQIEIPEIFKNQESSLFQFPLNLKRSKSYLYLTKVKLTISVYYTLEVGFQQTFFEIQNYNQQKYLVVSSDYPYQKCQDPNVTLLRLDPFRADKKFLKKIQAKVDSIRNEDSKYQISKVVSSQCQFVRSIWCELIEIKTPLQIKFDRKSNKIIEEYFTVRIAIHKKKDDLTPYKIKQGQQSYILSDQTTIIAQKTLPKMEKTENSNKDNLQINFLWQNLTREKECGSIVFETPLDNKMFASPKSIDFSIENWNKKQRQQIGPSELKIQYSITSKSDLLSHSLIVQPRFFPAIRKYIMSGKTKMKGKESSVSNEIKIKFFFEYEEQYMVGLKFDDDQVYWFPCIFAVSK